MRTKIADQERFERILDRLAYQILERNYRCEGINVVGIEPRGSVLAVMLKERLDKLGAQASLHSLVLDKDSPNPSEIRINPSLELREDYPVLLVDDVLYTGKTLINALVPLIQSGASELQIAVLVDRDYIKYPVRPDFTGLSLATTTQENVKVTFGEEQAIWLE